MKTSGQQQISEKKINKIKQRLISQANRIMVSNNTSSFLLNLILFLMINK